MTSFFQFLIPNYIIGNPPFVGMKFQGGAQKSDLAAIDKRLKSLDYVAGWYFKATQFMQGNDTRTAFLSTNSVAQGEQVGYIWSLLDCHIDFAYKTFTWDSESKDKAAVHCVVIGFSSAHNDKPKKIFDGKNFTVAKNINGYLLDAPNVYAMKRNLPLCDVPIMTKGNYGTENGNLMIKASELEDFVKREPAAKKYIRVAIGGDELINGKIRYCLWLVDCSPHELRKMPLVY